MLSRYQTRLKYTIRAEQTFIADGHWNQERFLS